MCFLKKSEHKQRKETFRRVSQLWCLFLLVAFLIQAIPASAQEFDWVQQMGWSYDDGGFDVAVDSEGNVYTVGFFGYSDETDDIFISKFDSGGILVWDKLIGDFGGDVAYSVAVDGDDNIYVSGEFRQTVNFDDHELGPAEGRDAFVCKISSAGAVLWAKQLRSPAESPYPNPYPNYMHDSAWGVTVGDDGSIYAVGDFIGEAQFGTFPLTSTGYSYLSFNPAFYQEYYDIFVCRLNPLNGDILWARKMGGESIDRGFDVAVDGDGNVCAVGFFSGEADFCGQPLNSIGDQDIFVSKFESDGNLFWATPIDGSFFGPPESPGNDVAYSVAVDGDGNIYTTGHTIDDGAVDTWVFKLDSSGNETWRKRLIGPPSQGSGVAVDGSGDIYITGHFAGWIGFDESFSPQPFNFSILNSLGVQDIFISKLDGESSEMVWATRMGGMLDDRGLNVTVDDSGHVYTVGSFISPNISFGNEPGSTPILFTLGGMDAFVIKLNNTGPVTSNVQADPNPVPIDTESIMFTATVDDSFTGGSNIAKARYKIRDTFTDIVEIYGEMCAADGTFDQVIEDVMDNLQVPLTYPGVFEVCVQGADVLGNWGDFSCIFVPVHDPDVGSVTGGGWIYSEPGSCLLTEACETAEGKANFGFVSEYKKGAQTPTGNTEFNFKAGSLNFHSDIYDWLVVAGSKAQYKGSGTINGSGDYSFILTAVDGDIQGGKEDRFRIMIWGDIGLVYDNKRGDDPLNGGTTEIGGGNITIHTK